VTGLRLFGAMLGIQIAIGALNDVVDAPLDARSKPRKPIPAGLVGTRVATGVAIAGAVLGIGLSAVSGVATALVGAACLALGWLYDVRLSRTSLSWLPLAIALPLLPIHAWLGAAGTVPTNLLLLVPVGILGGAGLAFANGLVDVERDARAGRPTASVVLGGRRTWTVQTGALGVAALLTLALAPGGGGLGAAGSPDGGDGGVLAFVHAASIVLGCGLLAIGALVLRSPASGRRERGWELEAIGVACLGISWLAGTASTIGAG
jgi:4-hydroxybenzoate polyprenyltransferase